MGRLHVVIVDIEGVQTIVDFIVIEIVDYSKPYPALLGLDWAFDNLAIINLKKIQMVFKRDDMRVIIPLAPSEGLRYTELVRDEHYDLDVDNIYHIVVKEEDWINLIADGKLGWDQDSSCTSDSEEEMENW